MASAAHNAFGLYPALCMSRMGHDGIDQRPGEAGQGVATPGQHVALTHRPGLIQGLGHDLHGAAMSQGRRLGHDANAHPGLDHAAYRLEVAHLHADDGGIAAGPGSLTGWLDSVVPDRPVALRAWDYHTMWVNTAALERAGEELEDRLEGVIPQKAAA